MFSFHQQGFAYQTTSHTACTVTKQWFIKVAKKLIWSLYSMHWTGDLFSGTTLCGVQ